MVHTQSFYSASCSYISKAMKKKHCFKGIRPSKKDWSLGIFFFFFLFLFLLVSKMTLKTLKFEGEKQIFFFFFFFQKHFGKIF